jgi:outer membrane lipoprotein-sorting protein
LTTNTSPERKRQNFKSLLPVLLAALFLPGWAAADSEPERIFSEMKQAVAAIKDYQARMKTTQKYFRIRGAGTLEFLYKRNPLFYYIYFHDDTRLNIIHPATPGSKLCYDRENRYYRVIGGGVMRLVGVQELPIDDPRYDYACGESFSGMNLFELARRMEWYEKHGTVSTDKVRFHGNVVSRVVMIRKGQPLQGQIQNMAIIFDPRTCLPLRVEYFGNPDPEGFTYFDYLEIKTNTGIKQSEYYF